jgi:hypothetical protein
MVILDRRAFLKIYICIYVLGLFLPVLELAPSTALGLFPNFLPPSNAVTALCSRPSESSFLTA